MTERSITVVAVSTVQHAALCVAIQRTLDNTPNVRKVLVFSDQHVDGADHVIPLRSDFGYRDYNDFVLNQLWPYIDTSHVLIIQPDSMAINAEAWHEDFWWFDYIGAATEDPGCYNGGFSLRSRRLLEAVRDPVITRVTYLDQQQQIRHIKEDVIITKFHRRYLEDIYQLRFCDTQTADQFSHEYNRQQHSTFGFHGMHNFLHYLDRDQAKSLISNMCSTSVHRHIYLALLADVDDVGIDLAMKRFYRNMCYHNTEPQGVSYT